MRCESHYLTVNEMAVLWGISPRRVNALCSQGRIEGAYKPCPQLWLIPEGTQKPADARRKGVREVSTHA